MTETDLNWTIELPKLPNANSNFIITNKITIC
jgi:hypothetical protein